MKKEYTAPMAETVRVRNASFLDVSGEVCGEDAFGDNYGQSF